MILRHLKLFVMILSKLVLIYIQGCSEAINVSCLKLLLTSSGFCSTLLRTLGKNSKQISLNCNGYTMIRILHPDDALSDIFELETNPEEGQPLQGNKNKRKKWKTF